LSGVIIATFGEVGVVRYGAAGCAALALATITAQRGAVLRAAVVTGAPTVARVFLIVGLAGTVLTTAFRAGVVVLNLTTAGAITVLTRSIRAVAVVGAVVLTITALTIVSIVIGVAVAKSTTALGPIAFVTHGATTGGATVVLAIVPLVAVLGAFVGAAARTVAVVGVVEGQTDALGRSALPTLR
jgi:hypothetical protein